MQAIAMCWPFFEIPHPPEMSVDLNTPKWGQHIAAKVADMDVLLEAKARVQEAAVIGVPHPKWTERPLLLVILVAGATPSKEDILASLKGQIASWWIPEDCVFVDEIPHTATGKVSKKDLREQFSDYQYAYRHRLILPYKRLSYGRNALFG